MNKFKKLFLSSVACLLAFTVQTTSLAFADKPPSANKGAADVLTSVVDGVFNLSTTIVNGAATTASILILVTSLFILVDSTQHNCTTIESLKYLLKTIFPQKNRW